METKQLTFKTGRAIGIDMMGGISSTKALLPIRLISKAWKTYTEGTIPIAGRRRIAIHHLLRLIGGLGFVSDLTITESSRSSLLKGGAEKEASLKKGSIDHWWGFWGGLLAVNLPFTWFFGLSRFGRDLSIPFTFGTYHLFGALAGAQWKNRKEIDYNEAFRYHFVSAFGDWISLAVIHGRRFLRPDLGPQIAAAMRMSYQAQFSWNPFGHFVDATWGAFYRRFSPQWLKAVIRPLACFNHPAIVKGFRDNNLLKPTFGVGGSALRLLWLAPYYFYQMEISSLIGMQKDHWGPHRLWKVGVYNFVGWPVRMMNGGEGPAAEFYAWIIGMAVDGVGTLFWNPRFEQKHWEGDLVDSLDQFQMMCGSLHDQKIAEHIFRGIFVRQMTDWWNPWEVDRGNQFYIYNKDYLKTFEESVRNLSQERLAALRHVIQIQEDKERMGQLTDYQRRGLVLLKAIVERQDWEMTLKRLNYGLPPPAF